MVTSEPDTSAAATNGKTADEMSPGMRRESGTRGEGRGARDEGLGARVTVRSFTSMVASIAASIRSVWSRAGPGWRMVVGPSAYSPASSSALLTWALAMARV
jgi:hypothetical protein